MKKNWLQIQNAKGDVAQIYIYGAISSEGNGTGAHQFVQLFNEIEAPMIEIHINSPGGDVFDGFAIFSTIVKSDKTINTYIDGIAASIASVIALAGIKVYMARNASYMIHNVTGFTWGTAKEHRKTAELLEKLEGQIIDVYQQKTGLPVEDLKKMMDEETWFNGQEAKARGFVDEVTSEIKLTIPEPVENIKQFNFKHYEKYLQTFNIKNIKTDNQTDEGEKMEEILKLLGVKDQATALAKISELQALLNINHELTAKLQAAQGKIDEFTVKEIDNVIETAIKECKLLPAQKEWAKNLAIKNREAFDQYLEQAKKMNITQIENIGDTKPGEITFEELLKDSDKYADMYENNRELFDELYDKFINGGE